MEKVAHNTEKNIQKYDKPGVPSMGSSRSILSPKIFICTVLLPQNKDFAYP